MVCTCIKEAIDAKVRIIDSLEVAKVMIQKEVVINDLKALNWLRRSFYFRSNRNVKFI